MLQLGSGWSCYCPQVHAVHSLSAVERQLEEVEKVRQLPAAVVALWYSVKISSALA
jgi:hypothetical protein